jgi:hypothetical protein
MCRKIENKDDGEEQESTKMREYVQSMKKKEHGW